MNGNVGPFQSDGQKIGRELNAAGGGVWIGQLGHGRTSVPYRAIDSLGQMAHGWGEQSAGQSTGEVVTEADGDEGGRS